MSDPVGVAKSFLGVPYVYGGTGRSGIDCSGLMCQAYPNLPRTAHEQFSATQRIGPDQLQAGDLVFLQGTQSKLAAGKASHVGIYDGQGGVIAAPHTGGRVQRESLANWQGRNVLGYGRVAGAMPKTRAGAVGPTSVPQRIPLGGNYGTAPDGSFDLNSYLQGALQSGGQRPQPHLFDPFSGQTVPNPDYNPTPTDGLSQVFAGDRSGLGLEQMFAPGPQPAAGAAARPYDDRQTVEQPSLVSQANGQATQAQASAPNPMAAQVAEQKARASLHKSIADLLSANPQAEYQLPENLPFPDRQQAAIPDRPAPQMDPLSAILATIAGVADPQAAGQYGQAPLQAGLDGAQQQYQDSLRHYQMQTEQLAQQYEHDLAKRNDLAHYQHEKAGVGFENANRAREAQLLIGQNTAQSGSEGGLADVLQGIGAQTQEAGGHQLQSELLNQEIARQLGANKAAVDYANAGDKREADIYKTLLQTAGRNYSSDNRLAGTQATNQTRTDVGAANNAAAIERAKIAAAAREEAAKTAAEASKYASNKRYNATVMKINQTSARAGQLVVNPIIPANIRSRMAYFKSMAEQTHKKLVDLQAQGQQLPADLVAEQAGNAAAFQAATREGDDWLKQHSAPAPGTRGAAAPGAAPAGGARPAAAPVITGHGFTLTPK